MTRPKQRVQDPDQRPGDVRLLKIRLNLLQHEAVELRLGTKVGARDRSGLDRHHRSAGRRVGRGPGSARAA